MGGEEKESEYTGCVTREGGSVALVFGWFGSVDAGAATGRDLSRAASTDPGISHRQRNTFTIRHILLS